MNFELKLFEYFDKLAKYMKYQPLNLGGYASYSGGDGGPPGGFTGYLPQSRVAYDYGELESNTTPYSGASILDNLNHIRYRISNMEASSLTVENNSIFVCSGVTVLNFGTGLSATQTDTGEVYIVASGGTTISGAYNENLTSQIGGGNTTFVVSHQFIPGTIQLYWNGLRQLGSYFVVSGNTSFITSFTPTVGDELLIDYDVSTAGAADHVHSEYVTYTYLGANYFTAPEVNTLLAAKANTSHTHFMADITDLMFNATSIQGIAVTSGVPLDNQVLSYDLATNKYETRSITINQQYILTIEGTNLSSTDVGSKPLRIYSQNVNAGATISEIFCAVNTPPGATPLRINVLKNGSTIFNAPAYVQIDAGNYSGSRTTSFASSTFTLNDYFQIELVQGDSVASDLTVHIRFSWEA